MVHKLCLGGYIIMKLAYTKHIRAFPSSDSIPADADLIVCI